MDEICSLQKASRGLHRSQKDILKSFQGMLSQPLDNFDLMKSAVISLEKRGLIEVIDKQVFLLPEGKTLLEEWQNPTFNEVTPSFVAESRQRKLEKGNQFLELYKQGLSYQAIGDQYSITRERVKLILNQAPGFRQYLKELEDAEVAAEQQKEELTKQRYYSRSLAARHPERVAELWDREKNGDLKPEDVPAKSLAQYIWLRCLVDGHSWQKQPGQITASWMRSGTSGCPMCAGKKKKAERQPALSEVYSELVSHYWNYEKNTNLNLDPETTTLSSNKKAWFKCPHDGNEWQASIASTVSRQWSKGNSGCKVCNGTSDRKRGEWQRREPISFEFPDEVAKYWFYEANQELGLDPMKLTIGSAKEAFFKCPIDTHEWVAPLTQIKLSWEKGNSGCPACRGFIAIETTSLISNYPDYVAQYWDYEKNIELGILPDKVTRGSTQYAWFKCPHDGYEWKTRIGSITRSSWRLGNSGCACCFGWNLDTIRQFVSSLEAHIPNLTQAELYKIFEQSGVLDTQNTEGLKIVNNIIRGKLTGQKLRDVIQGKEFQLSETDIDSVDILKTDIELQIVDAVASSSSNTPEISQTFQTSSDTQVQLDEFNELPKIKVQKSLEFLNSKIVASADREAIDFFIASRRNRIWAEVFEDESTVEAIEAFTDEGYGREVRDRFLDEYNQARDMTIPSGWAFRVDGKITPPNLMQKLAAVHLRSQKRMLNLSLTGTGKTIGGILSSRIIDAHLTIIICPFRSISN